MLVHSPVDRSERATLVQVSRVGLETTIDPDWRFDPGGSLRWWSLSPDGRRVALVVMEADRGDVWLKDLPDGRFERLTRGGGNKRDPLWTEDGARVFFVSDSLGQRDIWSVAADGGEAKLEWEAQLPISQHVTTPDPRRRIVRSAPVERFGRDLFEIDMSGGQPPRELTATEANETAPALSPDGRLLAYVSDEAGADNVYVQPYPDADGALLRISAGGGWSPVWSKDGKELFYLAAPPEADARPVMMSARILSDPLAIDGRAALFTLRPGYHSASGATAFDVTADGDFLLIKQRRETSTVLVVNFYAELQRLVPN